MQRITDFHGLYVTDEAGHPLALLLEDIDGIYVKRLPACSIGSYLFILTYFRELGYKVR